MHILFLGNVLAVELSGVHLLLGSPGGEFKVGKRVLDLTEETSAAQSRFNRSSFDSRRGQGVFLLGVLVRSEEGRRAVVPGISRDRGRHEDVLIMLFLECTGPEGLSWSALHVILIPRAAHTYLSFMLEETSDVLNFLLNLLFQCRAIKLFTADTDIWCHHLVSALKIHEFRPHVRIPYVCWVSLGYEPSILHGLHVLVFDSFGATHSEILRGRSTHHHSFHFGHSLPVLRTSLFFTFLICFRA